MVRLGWVRLPEGVGWRQLAGGAAAAGMAFTVSLVVADRAFLDAPALLDAAKTGITLSVLVCGAVAVGLLRGSARPRSGGVSR
jgi:NhaA family Na+:H+ antiporter